MNFLTSTFFLSIGLSIIFIFAQWLDLRCLGVKFNKFQLFYGKSIFSFKFFGTTYSIGWIPTGSSLTIEPDQFERISRSRRILSLFVGPVFLLLIAVAVLRNDQVFHYFITSFSQFFAGAMRPLSTGIELIEKLNSIYTTSFSTFVGLLAAKFSAINLIPFGLTNGGRCVYEVFFRNRDSQIIGLYLFITSWLFVAAILMWIFASIIYIGNHLHFT